MSILGGSKCSLSIGHCEGCWAPGTPAVIISDCSWSGYSSPYCVSYMYLCNPAPGGRQREEEMEYTQMTALISFSSLAFQRHLLWATTKCAVCGGDNNSFGARSAGSIGLIHLLARVLSRGADEDVSRHNDASASYYFLSDKGKIEWWSIVPAIPVEVFRYVKCTCHLPAEWEEKRDMYLPYMLAQLRVHGHKRNAMKLVFAEFMKHNQCAMYTD